MNHIHNIDVVIPLASRTPDFKKEFGQPRPLVYVNNHPIIKWATSCLEPIIDESAFIFPVLESHIEKYDIDDKLQQFYSDEITIVPIDGMTEGAADTVLKTRNHLSNNKLIILLGDQYIEAPLKAQVDSTDAEGLIPTFEADDPIWSYAAVSDSGSVTEVAEKEVISRHATAGIYYFQNGNDFVRGAESMIEKDIRTNGLFYLAPVYNELIEMSKQIEAVPVERMEPLGTLADVKAFESLAEDVNIKQ